MQLKNSFSRNNCIEILVLIIFIGISYTIIISCLNYNENFATSSDHDEEEEGPQFEVYIQAAINNKFTDETWDEIKSLTLMYPFIYQQLTLLGKKPSTYSLTLEDYYKTKENFIADLLKLYSKN
jgi:hypothetical protein